MAIPFRTVSGRWLDLERPQPCDIDVNDIACGLSRCCRFAGQIPRFYSVAHHALVVAALMPNRLKFRALHHDDSEAYLGDLSGKVKHSPYLQGYRNLERTLERVIEDALGLPVADTATHRAIKTIDTLVVAYEHAVLRLRVPFTRGVVVDLLEDGFIRGDLSDLISLMPLLDQVDDSILPRATGPAPSIEVVEAEFLFRHRVYQEGSHA